MSRLEVLAEADHSNVFADASKQDFTEDSHSLHPLLKSKEKPETTNHWPCLCFQTKQLYFNSCLKMLIYHFTKLTPVWGL